MGAVLSSCCDHPLGATRVSQPLRSGTTPVSLSTPTKSDRTASAMPYIYRAPAESSLTYPSIGGHRPSPSLRTPRFLAWERICYTMPIADILHEEIKSKRTMFFLQSISPLYPFPICWQVGYKHMLSDCSTTELRSAAKGELPRPRWTPTNSKHTVVSKKPRW